MDKPTQPPIPDLEASPSTEKSKEPTVTRRWKQNLDPKHADLVCLLLCFLTGLCDSSAYNAWSCFLGMQTGMIQSATSRRPPTHQFVLTSNLATGNTIFLGLGASNQPVSKPWGWLKSLVSIASFFSGAMIFSISMRTVGALRRGTLFASFLIQTILIIIAVALIQAN